MTPWIIGFAFDRSRFLCSDIGSLHRMKFWGLQKSEAFWAFMGITFEGEVAGVRCETCLHE
jgi:hypothetical protein